MQRRQQKIPNRLFPRGLEGCKCKDERTGELTLRVAVACIERNAVLFLDGRIEVALHFIYRLWYQVETELSISIEIVQKA